MRLTKDEIMLVFIVILVLSVGSAVRSYRAANPVTKPLPGDIPHLSADRANNGR